MLLTDAGKGREGRQLYKRLLRETQENHDHAAYVDGSHAAALAEYGKYLAYYKRTAEMLSLYGFTRADIIDIAMQDLMHRPEIPWEVKYLLAASGELELALELCWSIAEQADVVEISGDPDAAIAMVLDFLGCRDNALRKPYHNMGCAIWKIKFRAGDRESAGQIYWYGLEPSGAPSAPWHPASQSDGLFTGEDFRLTPQLLRNLRTDALS